MQMYVCIKRNVQRLFNKHESISFGRPKFSYNDENNNNNKQRKRNLHLNKVRYEMIIIAKSLLNDITRQTSKSQSLNLTV